MKQKILTGGILGLFFVCFVLFGWKYRASALPEGNGRIVSSGEKEDIVVLTALLNKSKDLQRYFSSYEKQALKKRMDEIKENPQNELIHKATDYIDTLFLLFIVAIS